MCLVNMEQLTNIYEIEMAMRRAGKVGVHD